MKTDLPAILKDRLHQNWFCLGIVALFSLFVILPIAIFGVPDGNDLAQHMRFAAVFHESILSGDFFPGWAGRENMGFGSIGIRYYPPIAYYLMALTQMLTHNWYQTFWINVFIWMFLGCAGVYFWSKEWLSPWQSALAAMLYAVAPYHLAQIYQFLLYAEYAATGILPFCFLFATRVIRRGRPLDVLLFSAAYSFLILTHIPLTIIGSVGLGIYALLLIDWKQPRKPIFNFAAAFGLSLAATAFHLLRAVSEVAWVRHNTSQYFNNGYYDYKKYFFPMIYSAGDQYGEKILWVLDLTIVLSLLLLLPLIVYAILQLRSGVKTDFANRKIIWTLAVVGLFSIFILSVPSDFIWRSLTVLQKTQFPWRWLALTSLIGTLGFTYGAFMLASHYPKLKKPVVYAALALLASVVIFDLTQSVLPSALVPENKFTAKLDDLGREPECVCWWTIWAKSEAFDRREKVSADSRATVISRWDSESREFSVEAGAAQTVRVATFYHPHWKAEANGRAVEVGQADDGSILIPVEAEKTVVRLYFEEPFKLRAALIVSLLTWAFLFVASFAAFRKQRKAAALLMAID